MIGGFSFFIKVNPDEVTFSGLLWFRDPPLMKHGKSAMTT